MKKRCPFDCGREEFYAQADLDDHLQRVHGLEAWLLRFEGNE